MTKTSAPDFEHALDELEAIVARMERGEQSLEATVKDFARGMALSEKCQNSLQSAQLKIDKLVQKHGDAAPDPLPPVATADPAAPPTHTTTSDLGDLGDQGDLDATHD